LRDQSIVRDDWHLSDLYFTFRKPLPASIDDTLTAIPKRQRAEVRKGINADLTFITNSDLASFYPVYTSSIRDLGSPGFHRRFYQSLLEVFGDRAEVATALHQGQPMSSVINFYFKNQVLLYYGGNLPQARELRSAQFLYWQIMNHALERGAGVFDFGRSMRDTGTYNFKKNWKFEAQPLHYHYFPINSKVPEIRPDNPTYARASRAWSHLPLPVAKLIGPFVARAIV
jgi:FemAB-related protein (PEP-CTERM system-associated)